MIATPLSCRAGWLALVLLAVPASLAEGQVIYPKPPAEYDVALRFQIRAPLPGWYDRYDEMTAALKRLGLKMEPLPAGETLDPAVDILKGTIASEDAQKLLEYPAVRTILLLPHGVALKAEDRVKVRLKIASGLSVDVQLRLKRQLMEKLEQIGFRESVGYDHHGFTWIVGTVEVPRLPELLRDARTFPEGWLAPMDPIATLPEPLRNRVPIRVVTVLPEPAEVSPTQQPPAPPTFSETNQHLAKVAPDLRPLISKEGDDTKWLRVEVILDRTPSEFDMSWERVIRGAGTAIQIEGRLGNVVTVFARANQVGELARPFSVIQVRLPRSGESVKRPATAPAINALAETRLNRLHEKGQRGQGVKIVVVGGDFSGYEKFVGKELPRATAFVDLTAARNPSIEPDPMPATESAVAQGVLSALLAHQAAPDATIVLVRVDPTSAQQLLLLARLINEPRVIPRVMEDRYAEIKRDRASIDENRLRVLDERRRAIAAEVFEEGDARVPEQRKLAAESRERIRKAEEALKELDKLAADLQKRTDNYLRRRAELEAVQGARVVICSLTWNTGFALDGASALSRYLDEQPFVGYPGDPTKSRIPAMVRNRGTIWVQAGGDIRGQTWTGLFRDADNNGTMEFAPVTASLPKGQWTQELNFIGWQDFDGKSAPDLPEKTRIRISMQWREPHDPALSAASDDPYRTPIANLSLVILRQRDPSGTNLPSDDMEIVARSFGTPVRLQLDSFTGTYEVTTEFDVPAAGRFAIQVEGNTPLSVRPAGDLGGGAAGLVPEIRPRIFVEAIDRESQGKGRVVLMDHVDDATWPGPELAAQMLEGLRFAGVGMPADAHNALTIGAAGSDGKVRYYSTVGAGPLRQLMVKPDLLGFDGIEAGGAPQAGSWAAAAFNGGLVACLIGADAPAQVRQMLQLLQITPGSVLRIPDSWLK